MPLSADSVHDGQKMKLLIIDEVHLLNEDRGAVIETIVARTLRLVSSGATLRLYYQTDNAF